MKSRLATLYSIHFYVIELSWFAVLYALRNYVVKSWGELKSWVGYMVYSISIVKLIDCNVSINLAENLFVVSSKNCEICEGLFFQISRFWG